MPDSPFDALVEAFRDAKTQMVEATRMVKADIVSPADPNAQKQSSAERRADYEALVSNPARLESEFMRLRDRYKLNDEKPIPRRLVEFIRSQHRLANRNGNDSD